MTTYADILTRFPFIFTNDLMFLTGSGLGLTWRINEFYSNPNDALLRLEGYRELVLIAYNYIFSHHGWISAAESSV
jgi:hypothetical protein